MIKFDALDDILQEEKLSLSEEIKENILVGLKQYIETNLEGLKFLYEDIIQNFEGDYISIECYVICPNLRGYRRKLFSIEIKDTLSYPVIFRDSINDQFKKVDNEDELVECINSYLKNQKVLNILRILYKDNSI